MKGFTPYLPETDGLVERYNQTLKNKLCKFVSNTGADWDQWLPYLLFAYWEVSLASTGFWPLDLLKHYWECPTSTDHEDGSTEPKEVVPKG